MGKAGKAMRAFIAEVPPSKLEGGIAQGTIHKDDNFRLDMQGLTTAKDDRPQMYNIQMQVNNHPALTSLEALAPNTVVMILAPVQEPTYTAAQIKSMLLAELIRKKM